MMPYNKKRDKTKHCIQENYTSQILLKKKRDKETSWLLYLVGGRNVWMERRSGRGIEWKDSYSPFQCNLNYNYTILKNNYKNTIVIV